MGSVLIYFHISCMKKLLLLVTLLLPSFSCSKADNSVSDESNKNNDNISINLIEVWLGKARYVEGSGESVCQTASIRNTRHFGPNHHFSVEKLVFDFSELGLDKKNLNFILDEDEELGRSFGFISSLSPSGYEQFLRRPLRVKYIEIINFKPHNKLLIKTKTSLGAWSQERLINNIHGYNANHGPIIFYDSNIDFIKFLEDNLIDRYCNSFNRESINKIFKKEAFDAEEFKRIESCNFGDVFGNVLTDDSYGNIQEKVNVKAEDLQIGDVVLLGVDVEHDDGSISTNAHRAWYKILSINR